MGDNDSILSNIFGTEFVEIFNHLKTVLQNHSKTDGPDEPEPMGPVEMLVFDRLQKTKMAVRVAFGNDLNFNNIPPTIVGFLQDLLKDTNLYLEDIDASSKKPMVVLLKAVANYITSIFHTFGLLTSKNDIIRLSSTKNREEENNDNITRSLYTW